ncbi:uncharacterized protein [Dermacentor albipictus]|uniref:uncharacterized protein n=1 Tax=Dermacentor albipictus TaxID=60249 RepID=UPI0038FCB701
MKRTVLQRLDPSQQSRLQRLLSEELGDQRPSQLLHPLRQLLGGHSANDRQLPILCELFLGCLQQSARMVLAGSDETSLDRLAAHADRIYDCSSAAQLLVAAARVSEPGDGLSHLEETVDRFLVHWRSLRRVATLATNFGATIHLDSLVAHLETRRGGCAGTTIAFSNMLSLHPALFADGKRTGQLLTTTCDIGPRASRLFFVGHRLTGTPLLIDIGAKLSIVPVTAADRQRGKSTPTLHAVNTAIATYKRWSITLDIGLRRLHRWVFVIADVSFAILGADYLSHFNLDVSA